MSLLLGACEGAQSAVDPKGPFARQLYELYVTMLVGGAVVLLIVLGCLMVALWSKSEPLPKRQKAGVLAGVVTTISLLVLLLVYNAYVSRAITAQPPDALEVEVVAYQWWWDISYPVPIASRRVRTANEIHIPVNRPVTVTVKSRDVVHSFWVPSLHGKVDAIPGTANKLTIEADVPGVYRGQCAEFCGLQHAHMAFVVVAESEIDFERWLAAQRLPAAPPADELGARGKEVFMTHSCPMCHMVRGTEAMASVGPDLTHLASRRTLAAATLANRRGQLAGWILDPQHVKPGNFMPRNDLDGERLLALLHYLESLR